MLSKSRVKQYAASIAALVAALGVGASVTSTASAATVKLPKSGVETPPTATLSETGSTLLFPLWNLWVPGYNKLFPHLTVETAATGSGTGITDASNGTAEIGSSDAYLSPTAVKANPNLLNIPLAISAQLIAYNVPGVTGHLKLPGKVLSEIYQGKITTWNASAIAKVNPGVTLPNIPIVTLHRADSSGDTFLFTSYLSQADPAGWGTTVGFNTTVPWPNAPGALAATGNSGMVTGCAAQPGCIAYVGISYQAKLAAQKLNYASLQNGKGAYVLPTATSIGAEAAYFVKKTPADGAISMIYGPVASGYPIINYEYAIVNKAQASTQTAQAIRSVLEWSVNKKDGNSSTYLNQVDFQPLPAKVTAQSVKQILSIK